jgi:putative endonuclease
MEEETYSVYILFSEKDKKLYIGYTPSDVYSRFQKHVDGLVPSTRVRRPLQLIYFEVYTHQDDATRREKYFKTTPGKRAIKHMLRKTLTELNI